jgi:multidrug efflux pump subunit AcrB
VQSGTFLTSAAEISQLVVGVYHDSPVYLEDVATVSSGSAQAKSYSWMGTKQGTFPSVTLAIAKKTGTNAVGIANRVIERFSQLEGLYIPEGMNISITRNYGATADTKAKKLMQKLTFATASVVLLVLLTMGWREAIVVGLAVVITLAITLFASWAYGFTLNRVSLFALIFSIGILVDDAIVVVENIHRHMQLGQHKLAEAIPLAVNEVGGPTILATFAVIAALLPMAFVTGLMGPYMSPIPINASMGMLISLMVAFMITPWLTFQALKNVKNTHNFDENAIYSTAIYRFFKRILTPLLVGTKGQLMRWGLFSGIMILITGSILLVNTQHVILKMLPFDNKSEFQIIVDMNEGTSLEQTARVLDEVGHYISSIDEVIDYQVYVGDAAPINFNGLVRQYYLREGSHLGDIQVNLVDKHERKRKSHQIALEVREGIRSIAKKYEANIKVVEVPPGPPVMSPLVAEVYGLDYTGQIKVARQIKALFQKTPDIIDIDDSVEYPAKRFIVKVDREKAALLGVSQQAVNEALNTVLNGEDVGYLHGNSKYPVPIRLNRPISEKTDIQNVLNLKVRSVKGKLLPISTFVDVLETQLEHSINHKDLLPVVYVQADMSGPLDSPLYGLFEMSEAMSHQDTTGDFSVANIQQYFVEQPDNPYQYSMKWDGEWQVTYETFRDMGIAYAVGMLLIYLLVVAQFRSYLVPLIIMAPIPLTIIGVLPGHFLLDAKFTATSMIGMIALAGILVRNSILLVDFINSEVQRGLSFQEAIIQSAAVRAKPIVLTGLAAMLGAFFILDDPIFSGLAVSLIFGLLVSTVLTLIVIPVMYYAFMNKRFA